MIKKEDELGKSTILKERFVAELLARSGFEELHGYVNAATSQTGTVRLVAALNGLTVAV